MSCVYVGDGCLIVEYVCEYCVFVFIENIFQSLVQVFILAEDKNFYEYGGLDFCGIICVVFVNICYVILGECFEGVLMIIQQVVKNFLLFFVQ